MKWLRIAHHSDYYIIDKNQMERLYAIKDVVNNSVTQNNFSMISSVNEELDELLLDLEKTPLELKKTISD